MRVNASGSKDMFLKKLNYSLSESSSLRKRNMRDE